MEFPFAKLRKNLERVLGTGVAGRKGGIKIYFRHVMFEMSIKKIKVSRRQLDNRNLELREQLWLGIHTWESSTYG